MDNSYIKLSRKIMQWEWYKNEHTKNVFIHCLLKAYWKDTKIEGKTITRGSFVSSIGKIAEELELTPMEVRTALKHLNLTNEITSKGTNRNTVFTVNNYDLYQANEQAEQQTDNKQITNKEQADNEQITSKQQTINKPLTTNEEDKEEKEQEEIKEEEECKEVNNPPLSPMGEADKPKRKKFTIPTVEEVEDYCFERNNKVDAEMFVNFYSSKGWMIGKNPMKDWKAAVRTWERKDKENGKAAGNRNSGSIDWDNV